MLREINQLTPEDVDKLREQEAESSKSIEQLAIDQLDQLKMLNAQVGAAAGKTVLGFVTTDEQMRAERLGNAVTRSLGMELNKNFGTKDVRKEVSNVEGTIEGGIIKTLTTGDLTALGDAGKVAIEKLANLEEKFIKVGENIMNKAINTSIKDVMDIYKKQTTAIS